MSEEMVVKNVYVNVHFNLCAILMFFFIENFKIIIKKLYNNELKII